MWRSGAVKLLSPADAGVGNIYPGDAHSPTNLGAPALGILKNGTMLVAATTRPPSGPNSISAISLTSTLDPTAGPAVVMTTPAEAMFPSVASDGTGFAVGGATHDGNQSCIYEWSSRAGIVSSNLSNQCLSIAHVFYGLCVSWYEAIPLSFPSMAFNGSRYVLAWSDSHGDGVLRAYVATMTTAGVVSGAHTVTTAAAESAGAPYFSSAYGNVQVAMGPKTAIVAWGGRPPTGDSAGYDVLRYAIMDTDLNGVLKGPFDVGRGGGPYIITSAAHVGTSFAIARQSSDGANVTVFRVDETTGAILGSAAIANGASGSDVKLLGIHGGFALTISRGSYIGFAWVAEDLAGGIQLQDLFNLGSSTTSSGGLAAIDPTHFAVAWADGQLKGTIVSCGDP